MDKGLIVNAEEVLEHDPWEELKQYTDARIALGRAGCALPTKEYLDFSLAHARARDTIHKPFNRRVVREKLQDMGLATINAESAAPNRSVFLTRPDLGRQLSDSSRAYLQGLNYAGADLCIVIGDGLSSKAVHKQAVPLIKNLLPYLEELKMSLAPIVLAEQSRVALGDDIAETLHCRCVAILIGERPGLSSPDSLGVYMTYAPSRKRLESERNCISNIRPEGLTYDKAAFKLAWLLESAFKLKISGTTLKDNSDDPSCYLSLKPHDTLLL